MNKKVVVSASKPMGWSRGTSFGSDVSRTSSNTSASSVVPSPPSSELCALISFAYKLGSSVHNNDSNIIGNNSDVRREAKLLMSLSCSSPVQTDEDGEGHNIVHQNCNSNYSKELTGRESISVAIDASSSSSSSLSTGRITPTHSITSMSSGGSRRDTFCFTCPSLSLDDAQRGTNNTVGSSTNPGSMLSRTLKVDDQDAMRLSSEAMARNVIESVQKAIEWRILSWVDSLSNALVVKEMELKHNTIGDDLQQLQQELYYSNEALLIVALGEIKGKINVLEANTAFKVLNKVSQVDETGLALKKRRVGEEEDRTGLEEGEYVYDVVHILEMQCTLNISTPAGNVQVDLNVPGKINGTFLSGEDDACEDKLTDVAIHLNTEMMASMIEKCSRIAVRVSAEALLKGEQQDLPEVEEKAKAMALEESQSQNTTLIKKTVTTSAIVSPPPATRSPKRKATEDRNVPDLMVITPARNTNSSLTQGRGSNTNPVGLQIPSNFPRSRDGGRQSQVSQDFTSDFDYASPSTTKIDFAARLPPKKLILKQKKHSAAIITPLKTMAPEYIQREKGPNLPVLVEAACAAIKKN
ncbi:unnamed protein product [Pseudo-nitzschia multistriata]|uniref:Uncharacterized protein n=1 Tax=Pseudo-nitzschia multistriata TaxID=183589 RepID=A0A448ZF66_9STRA|nr:unnamed protein product [Pseudo-nitzschia multistriata]